MTSDRDMKLEAFLAAQHGRVLGLLVLHVGDRWVAEELAQDVLLRVAERWPKVSRMEQPSGWVTRVALNVANSSLRRTYAGRRAKARLHERPTETDHADVLAVRAAVAALPRRQRTAVVLRHFTGHSVRETADVMGIAEGTVTALTHQALTALRAEFDVPDATTPTTDAPTAGNNEENSHV